uniref:Large ribosomal subunit protein uL13c n=1 Tax=Bangiopsis subsimplex TaxID=139980 RepID=A0A1C9CD28_9RHOD|nr:ribosomal protein L13 [Bangiopsis subsimplex]AOM66254.1 ribosomal protein L13 [Bangiopsis subsimplex]ARO90384.1 50S ribosomal protein L13 [Bangiopsis subsimplex]
MNRTCIVNKKNVEQKWYLIDAKGQTLGRISTEIANILRGKNKAIYNPSMDLGDFVIVINASAIKVSGNKSSQKLYRRHSGRPGGMKTETFDELIERIPARIIENAVKGMLPKGPLGRQIFKKLKVYGNDNHPHLAQQPFKLEVK